ncbi:hypothetical protein RE628_07095 [Paenibacillus sp. D2_2]|uniref:hypothetical protein n=1 Tax=Paenibacillus sp. D2_2 TaxID=3073092 RepID=UPI002816062D|nr:hypothetical protein [Paenibacillus sp. D2_2]WMT42175.1 hypothetical protein RE628_07095 [Paenibacillus sp. D2_2]
MRLAVYCDFISEGIHPLQLIVQPESGELDWSEVLYLPLSGPFEPFEAEQFGDLTGVSVLLEDLIVNRKDPEKIGIRLSQISARHPEADIALFILQIADVEEVLGYRWEQVNLSN